MIPSFVPCSRVVLLLVASALLAASVATSGCARTEGPPPRYAPTADTTAWTTTGDAVVSRLDSLDLALMDSAFAALPRVPLTRTTRTDAFTPADSLRGQLYQTWHHRPKAEPELLEETQTGTLPDRDLWGLVPRANAASLPENIVRDAYPDEPPFLEARNQPAYRYGMRRDTLAPGIPVDRIEVVARDTGDGRRMAIPYARVDVLPGTRSAVSTYVVRADRALLYDEDSLFYIALQPGPNGQWLPHIMRFRARLSVPLRPVESVQTVTTFASGE
ncbi:hypothetical protein CRI93_10690 [Longimonas halophila]|uniref:Uncharacterized protein n=1 Tax=Longimonas halophila TaxID=1469170 RepID=A0A2H3NN50_9BACT|nr:hypothetical protein [Longimonas halophila]PEN06280.1 hypothetical protein CRI93_10690 [Longimonas halophila]